MRKKNIMSISISKPQTLKQTNSSNQEFKIKPEEKTYSNKIQTRYKTHKPKNNQSQQPPKKRQKLNNNSNNDSEVKEKEQKHDKNKYNTKNQEITITPTPNKSNKPKIPQEEVLTCYNCMEPYNKSTRLPVECILCKYKSCRECYQRYFLSTVSEPHCMNCKDIWGFMNLYSKFTKVWVNGEFIKHRAGVFMSYEKSKLPQAQHHAQREKDYERKVEEYNLIDLKYRKESKLYQYGTSLQKLCVYQLEKEKKKKNKELMGMNRNRPKFKLKRMGNVDRKTEDPFTGKFEKNQITKTNFTWHCPDGKCRGFLDEKYVCPMCKIRACEKCHIIIEKDHKCNKDMIETINHIKKTTKQCPNCHVPIHKISGCPQMFCTQCFKAFDYKTGKSVQGRIHNPHYYQYLRENKINIPREEDRLNAEQQQNPCGLPHTLTLVKVSKLHRINFPIYEFRRIYLHIEDVIMYRYVNIRDTVKPDECSMFLRIKYLIGELNDTTWNSILVRHEKSKACAHEALQIYYTWIQYMLERIRLICYEKNIKSQKIFETVSEILKFTKMTNRNLHELSLSYGISIYYIKFAGELIVSHRGDNRYSYQKIINDYIDPVNRKKFKNSSRPVLEEIEAHYTF